MLKLAKSLGIRTRSRCRLEVHNWRTGRIEQRTGWIRNLLLDQGLNGLAQETTNAIQCYPSQAFLNARIGDSNAANEIASGAITFTQSGTTLTASASFFTAAMVGGIFKWGSGSSGNERYIASYTSATQVTLDTSETVGTPDTGSVWMVQRTALVNQIAVSTGYRTNGGDNGISIVGNVATLQRTFTFAPPGVAQNVNEIGYYKDNSTARVYGRIVLPSTVVVGTSNFLVLILQLELTYSPAAPTAVSDVGTNLDTAGNAMLEIVNIGDWGTLRDVQSSGAVGVGSAIMDGSGGQARFRLYVSSYSQDSATNNGSCPVPTAIIRAAGPSWSKVSGVRGAMRFLETAQSVTTAGQTLYGLGLGGFTSSGTQNHFDIRLTTTPTLPTGTFTYDSDFRCVYSRTLTNS
jgi:hypothetical protein